MRKINCQRLGSSGGATVKASRLAWTDKIFAKSRIGANESGRSVRRCRSVLYWDFSTEQHPVSSRSELCSSWQSLSVGQARNSRLGTVSNRQCMVIGSQATANRTTNMFLKDRTPDMDTQSARYVQSNLFRIGTIHRKWRE